MGFEIVKPISYGKDGMSYQLAKGDVVPKSFFTKAESRALWEQGLIKKSGKGMVTTVLPVGEVKPVLTDLTTMNVGEAKEFLEEEPHVDMLEKYLDQANAEEFPRKTITQFIERRIRELTGSPFLS